MAITFMGRSCQHHSPAKYPNSGKEKWIAGAIKSPGALHRQLRVPEDQKIPAGKLAKAAAKGGILGRMARLAQTLKGLHK